REAFEVARGLGWANLCRRLDSGRLLTLADVARYAGAPVQARRAFEALVVRFPHERSTADAVFTLGRLAYEAHQPNHAARWFRRYLDGWSDGPLADQAAGRLLECAVRSDHREEARRAARAYLARAPGGPHAPGVSARRRARSWRSWPRFRRTCCSASWSRPTIGGWWCSRARLRWPACTPVSRSRSIRAITWRGGARASRSSSTCACWPRG